MTTTAAVDPIAPVVMTYGQKIANNFEIATRSGSTYVVLIAGILGALYASMTTVQQTQLIEAWPVLKGWTPVITVVIAFVVTKLKPSNTISSGTQAMLTELAVLRMNSFLRARGSPELPAPPPAPLPVVLAPIPIPAPPAPPPVAAALLAPSAPLPGPVAPAPVLAPGVAMAFYDPADPREVLARVRELLAPVPAPIPPHVDPASHLP